MIKAAVIGNPIEHSISPLIHSYWLKKYNILGEYNKIRVLENELEIFFADFVESDLSGFNITIPHKESALKYLNDISEEINVIKAVNTVYKKGGNIYGINTDAEGFIKNIYEFLPELTLKDKICTVLGSGGASRAIIYALIKLGCRNIRIVNRNIDKAEIVKKDYLKFYDVDFTIYPWELLDKSLVNCSFLINTTSLGMKGMDNLNIDFSMLENTAIVSDIVYNPLETNFLKDAKDKGNFVIDGLGMLLHQAVSGFELWFGIKPEVDKNLRNFIINERKL